jgi:hypothetical protein
VDVLGQIIAEIDGTETPASQEHPTVAPRSAPDYSALTLDQLAGPVGSDAQRHGWPQLGGRSVNDAVAYIKEHTGEPPPFQGRGHLGAVVGVVPPDALPSLPSPEPGQSREQDSRRT